MGIPVKFTPFYGAQEEGPIASLLQIDDFTILLDCGWNDAFDVALLEPLTKALATVDVVLLTQPDTQHLGALPYLVGKAGLPQNTQIYATLPVVKMGTMFMYDHFHAQQAVSDFELFSLDDVDATFDRVTQLKYLQSHFLTGKGEGLTITAHASGHMVGGTVWLISQGVDTIMYAPHFNHKRERHLNGSKLESLVGRPAVLITGSSCALSSAPSREARDKALLDKVLEAVRAGGRVLLPVDTAGRVLELLMLLEATWEEERFVYPLIFLSSVAHTTLDFARSQLEYMADDVNKRFGHTRANPFSLRHVVLCTNAKEVPILAPGPAVVLATGPSLNTGLARQVLLQFAEDANNLVLFTQPPKPGTLAAQLLSIRSQSEEGYETTLTVATRVPLEGEELEAYEAAIAAAEEQEAIAAAAALAAAAAEGGQMVAGTDGMPLRANSLVISKLVLGSSGGMVQVLPEDAFAALDQGRRAAAAAAESGILIDGFQPPAQALYPMFPDEEEQLMMEYTKYGVVDTELLGAINTAAAAAEGEAEVETEVEEEMQIEEGPTKVVKERVTLVVAAKFATCDYRGLSDGRSVRTIVGQLSPRQLVFIAGSRQATQELAKATAADLKKYNSRVVSPGMGEEISLSLTRFYDVLLGEGLLASLHQHALGPYTLAWCGAQLTQAPGDAAVELALVPADVAIEGEDVLMEEAAGGTDHGGIFIGDVKLSEVKQALAKAGIASEFHRGELFCSGAVRVKRAEGEEAHLMMEGPLSEDYFKVRDVVYGQYNVC